MTFARARNQRMQYPTLAAQAPWNAVLTCAGRCGQLRRGFEILDKMQQHGVEADVISLGSIVEACVLAGNADLALKVVNRVLAEVRACVPG